MASFVVNEYVERGVTEIPPRLHVAVDDSELYVHNTKQVRVDVDVEWTQCGGGRSGSSGDQRAWA